MRRLGDLLIAGAIIIFTMPLMAISALAIKWDGFGPVLYRQERVGLNGRRFMLLKFRSMVVNAEPDGRPVWAAERDARITRVGRFLRRARIDEFPQLFNVLCGDVSVVGPRPERPYFVDQLTKRLTENELSDFSRLWHDGCGKTIIEAQDVDQNHSAQV